MTDIYYFAEEPPAKNPNCGHVKYSDYEKLLQWQKEAVEWMTDVDIQMWREFDDDEITRKRLIAEQRGKEVIQGDE